MTQSEMSQMFVLRAKANRNAADNNALTALEAKFVAFVASLPATSSRIELTEAAAIAEVQAVTGLVRDAGSFGAGTEMLCQVVNRRNGDKALLAKDGRWVNGNFSLTTGELKAVNTADGIYYKANVITIPAGLVYTTKGTDGVERVHVSVKESLRMPYRQGSTGARAMTKQQFVIAQALEYSKTYKCSIQDAIQLLQAANNAELVSAITAEF